MAHSRALEDIPKLGWPNEVKAGLKDVAGGAYNSARTILHRHQHLLRASLRVQIANRPHRSLANSGVGVKAESRQPARVLGLAHFAQSGDGRPKTITLHLSEPLAVELGEVHSTGLPQMEACGLTHRYMRVEQPGPDAAGAEPGSFSANP